MVTFAFNGIRHYDFTVTADTYGRLRKKIVWDLGTH